MLDIIASENRNSRVEPCKEALNTVVEDLVGDKLGESVEGINRRVTVPQTRERVMGMDRLEYTGSTRLPYAAVGKASIHTSSAGAILVAASAERLAALTGPRYLRPLGGWDILIIVRHWQGRTRLDWHWHWHCMDKPEGSYRVIAIADCDNPARVCVGGGWRLEGGTANVGESAR
jgi:hypothetical protein